MKRVEQTKARRSYEKECLRNTRKWQMKNKERVLAYSRQWRREHKERDREVWLKWKYNLSVKEYNSVFEDQSRKCALCLRPQEEFQTRLCVDHDHKTGEVRGLLCKLCNAQLHGLEDKAWKERAEAYLKVQIKEK